MTMRETRCYTSNAIHEAIHELHGIARRPPLALTPQAWLDLLPSIVAQLEPEQHEEFVIRTLKAFDAAGAEVGGCLVDEWW